jgi:ABC-type lipoprotein release transport system permease subunit
MSFSSSLLKDLLFDVEPWDLLIFVLAGILVAVIGFLACFAPAKRASRVDQIVALKSELGKRSCR